VLSRTWPVTHISSTRRIEITSLDDCQLSPTSGRDAAKPVGATPPRSPALACFLLPVASVSTEGGSGQGVGLSPLSPPDLRPLQASRPVERKQ